MKRYRRTAVRDKVFRAIDAECEEHPNCLNLVGDHEALFCVTPEALELHYEEVTDE